MLYGKVIEYHSVLFCYLIGDFNFIHFSSYQVMKTTHCFLMLIFEELESYAKQAEEFFSFGDLQDVQRYLKKAQILNGKLDLAADKV